MEEFLYYYEEKNYAGCLSYHSLHTQEFEELTGDERLHIHTMIACSRLNLRDFVGALEICRSLKGLIEIVKSVDIMDKYFCVFIEALLHQRDSEGKCIEKYFIEASKLADRVTSVQLKEKIIFTMKILKEQRRGIYNLGDLIFEIERPFSILISDFVHPGISVEKIEEKGRGCKALRNFESGDLLIVEKCIFRGSPCLSHEESLVKLEEDLTYGLRFCPTLKHRLNNLSDGKIIFKETNTDIEISETLRGIIQTNAFVELHQPNMAKFFLDFKSFPQHNIQHELFVCILFERISMLNHSCRPNCNTVFFGDVGYVVAVKPIMKGEELCFDYFSGRSEKWNMKRRNTISQHFGIDYRCNCRICENGKSEFQKWQKEAKRLEDNSTPTSELLEYYISQRSKIGDDLFHPNSIDIVLLFASALFFPSQKQQQQQQQQQKESEELSKLSEWKMDFFDQICEMLGSHGHGLVFSFFQTLHFLVDMKEFRKCLKEREEVFWNSVFCKIFGKSKSSRDVFDSWLQK